MSAKHGGWSQPLCSQPPALGFAVVALVGPADVDFGSSLEVCFGETLNRYRVDPKLAFIEREWDERHFMRRGSVPADWRSRRTAVRARVNTNWQFLNVEETATRRLLYRQLAAPLAMFDVDRFTVDVIRGPDRRVTRLISQWAWQQGDRDGEPVFAGVRYLSRTSTQWECWAVFDDLDIIEVERQPIL